MVAEPAATPRKKDVALAFIVERIARSGVSPSYGEIAHALKVSKKRVGELVDQLVADQVIDRTPGSHRGLRIRDVGQARQLLTVVLGRLGWEAPAAAVPFPHDKLPTLPDVDHNPGQDSPGRHA